MASFSLRDKRDAGVLPECLTAFEDPCQTQVAWTESSLSVLSGLRAESWMVVARGWEEEQVGRGLLFNDKKLQLF